jgi:superfamily I DNA/RNA helicase
MTEELLDKIYRNTIEISESTQRFIGEIPHPKKMYSLFQEEIGSHGELPEIRRFTNIKEIKEFLIENISKQIRQEQFKRSEIAVIYDDKNYGLVNFNYDNRELPERLLRLFENSGIPTKWVSKNINTKEEFDITTDRVSLVSIHSSKGLDFELVYLIGIDNMQPTEKTQDYLARLLYVAMTRAKYKLVITYIEETEFIKKMKACLNQGLSKQNRI